MHKPQVVLITSYTTGSDMRKNIASAVTSPFSTVLIKAANHITTTAFIPTVLLVHRGIIVIFKIEFS